MKLNDEIVLYLYRTGRTAPLQYVSYNQLYSNIIQSQGRVSENDFTSSLRYLVGKKYIQEEAAHYRIMSEGDEYAQILLNPPVDYTRESFHEQRRSNEVQWKNFIVAIAALVVACIGILVTLIISNIRTETAQPQLPPTSSELQVRPPYVQPQIFPTNSQPTLAPTVIIPTVNPSPVMLRVTERRGADQTGVVIYKDIYFMDPDGDADFVEYKLIGYQNIVQSDIKVSPDDIEPSPEQKTEATVAAPWYCKTKYHNYTITLEARIVDEAGNKSMPFLLEFYCR